MILRQLSSVPKKDIAIIHEKKNREDIVDALEWDFPKNKVIWKKGDTAFSHKCDNLEVFLPTTHIQVHDYRAGKDESKADFCQIHFDTCIRKESTYNKEGDQPGEGRIIKAKGEENWRMKRMVSSANHREMGKGFNVQLCAG